MLSSVEEISTVSRCPTPPFNLPLPIHGTGSAPVRPKGGP